MKFKLKHPLETKEILERCIKKLENTGEQLDKFGRRISDWKQNNCAPKVEFGELVGWRTLAKDVINTRISNGLKRCHLQTGKIMAVKHSAMS